MRIDKNSSLGALVEALEEDEDNDFASEEIESSVSQLYKL